MVVQGLDGFCEASVVVESSQDVPKSLEPQLIKGPLEMYEVVGRV